MIDLRGMVILGTGLLVCSVGFVYSLFCVFAPRRMILFMARFKSTLDENTASDRTAIRECRIMAVIMALGSFGFVVGLIRTILRGV